MKPMLASSIPLASLNDYVTDPEVVVQQKLDGDRLLIVVDDGKVQVLNREGKERSNPIPRGLVDAFAGMSGSWAFDGELLDGELWLFDLPRAGDAVVPAHPYSFRLDVLERFFSTWQPGPFVRLLPTARSTRAKQRLVCDVLSSHREGVIVRYLDAPYTPGKRSLRMLKAKVTHTVDCVVTSVRAEGRDNCHVSLFDDGQLVEVGSCAMFGKPPVAVGNVCEVKYLYANTGRRLVQPAFLRIRDDKAAEECTIDQFVFTDRSVVDVREEAC